MNSKGLEGYWQEAHPNFFSRSLAKIGREFSEDMPLVCERFRLIYKSEATQLNEKTRK